MSLMSSACREVMKSEFISLINQKLANIMNKQAKKALEELGKEVENLSDE